MQTSPLFTTKHVQKDYNYKAPDTTEIRLLPSMKGGGLAHCTLRPGHTSNPIFHKTVEEIWYFIEGEGLFARSEGDSGTWEVAEVESGVSVTIPVGVRFQFRNNGDVPLKSIIVTMPRWPGKNEAAPIAKGNWRTVDEMEQPPDKV